MHEIVGDLIEKPYYVIDFLPFPVGSMNKNTDMYSDVDSFYCKEPQLTEGFIAQRNILLKTLCYFEFEIYSNKKKVKYKDAFQLEKLFKKSYYEGKSLYFVLKDENTLIYTACAEPCLVVHTTSKKVEKVMKVVATAEGMYWCKH